jgi:hypothetical protein
LMDLVLHGLTYKYCLVYLDDTIIYSKSFDEHLEHVAEVLERIEKAGLKLRPEKCVFGAESVNYLGYVISRDGIKPDGDKIKVINEMKFPRTAKAMIRFLGVVNFYRDFILRYSNTASALYKMSQSEAKFKAKKDSKSAQEAFEKLKACLMAEPILTYPDFTKPFVVQTDASGVALGAVIGQFRVVNGVNKFFPMMYGSRHLTDTESRWSATERELLAITWANKRFSPYVFGRHVTYVTDHEPLVTLRELKDPAGRLGRLFNHIQDQDYTLVYQPGVLNYTADMLSRPDKIAEVNAMEMAIGSAINWPKEQQEDAEVKKVFDLVERSENFDVGGDEEDGLWAGLGSEWSKLRAKLVIISDVLMVEDDDALLKIVVPAKVVSVLLKFKHDLPLAGHRGFDRTFGQIKSRYYWDKMSRDVKEYCATCHLCQTKKYMTKVNKAPMKNIIVNTPWSLVGIDVVGPFKRSIDGNMYALLAVDYFTKFAVVKAVPDFTAETTAKFLFEEIICKLGAPRAIISDHGVNFKAQLFKRLCVLCGVETANSTIYHAEGNGCVERMNKTMKQIVTMYVDADHANWDDFLQPALSAYNTTKQASIGYSPYEANFGRVPITLADVMLTSRELDLGGERRLSDYVDQLKSNASKVNKKMVENLAEARATQKAFYDRSAKEMTVFKVKDWVVVINERNKTGESKSFKERALGPFEVVEIFNQVNYRIVSVATRKEYVVHYNRMRPYRCRFGMEAKLAEPVKRRSKADPKPVAGVKVVERVVLTSRFWELVRLGQERVNEANQAANGEQSEGTSDGEEDGGAGRDQDDGGGGHEQDEDGEVDQLEGEQQLELSEDEEEVEVVGGGEAVAVVNVEVEVLNEEEDLEVALVQCEEVVEGVRCTKMCKPRGMGIHLGWHNKQKALVAEESRSAPPGGIFNVIGSFFSAAQE